MKRKWIAWLLMLCCTLCFFACNKEEKTTTTEIVACVEATEENMVAIKVTSVGEVFLLEVMNELQAKGELSFEVDATKMVTSINGKENPADWSACWMLYTSDADFSNETYGTYDYEGVTYKSALFGAAQMPVMDGGYYIWVYKAF